MAHLYGKVDVCTISVLFCLQTSLWKQANALVSPLRGSSQRDKSSIYMSVHTPPWQNNDAHRQLSI